MTHHRGTRLTAWGVLLGVLWGASPASAVVEAPAFVEGRVADASDRAYESTAIWLIDGAQASVVCSLYLVQETDDVRHPVHRLLNDLVEAAQRGVAVTLYLNTRLRGVAPRAVAHAPWVAPDRRWTSRASSFRPTVRGAEREGRMRFASRLPSLARRRAARLLDDGEFSLRHPARDSSGGVFRKMDRPDRRRGILCNAPHFSSRH